ncbi:MAG: serine protease [Cyclobacterium sp.]|uniref:trypsin-like peptidase domain-containing protein n=1 Tax=Cyclobacterium sp. TaxID=1966343 RepID=UPI0039710DEC
MDGPTQYDAHVITRDPELDLALLLADGLEKETYLRFAESGEIAIGQEVLVAGYPLSSILGPDVRVTRGHVAALSGVRGDKRAIQITAPIQPGNSGGPVLNDRYEVVGVVASKLSDSAAFNATGSLPQNVNFAVAGTITEDFAMDIVGPPREGMPANDIETAVAATVRIEAGAGGFSSARRDGLRVDFNYRYAWDLFHYTLGSLSIRFIDVDTGQVVARADFSGVTLDSYDTIVRETMRELLRELRSHT